MSQEDVDRANEQEGATQNINVGAGWRVKQETCESCPYGGEVTIYLHPSAARQIFLLCSTVKGEWLAYLDGEKRENGSILVDNLRIPKQRASYGAVEVDEFNQSDRHVGVMHSHHNLKCGFSGTDDEFINQNHNLSLLVNHDTGPDSHMGFKITGQHKHQVPCGAIMVDKVKVVFQQWANEGEDVFLKSVEENVKPMHTQMQAGTPNHGTNQHNQEVYKSTPDIDPDKPLAGWKCGEWKGMKWEKRSDGEFIHFEEKTERGYKQLWMKVWDAVEKYGDLPEELVEDLPFAQDIIEQKQKAKKTKGGFTNSEGWKGHNMDWSDYYE